MFYPLAPSEGDGGVRGPALEGEAPPRKHGKQKDIKLKRVNEHIEAEGGGGG